MSERHVDLKQGEECLSHSLRSCRVETLPYLDVDDGAKGKVDASSSHRVGGQHRAVSPSPESGSAPVDAGIRDVLPSPRISGPRTRDLLGAVRPSRPSPARDEEKLHHRTSALPPPKTRNPHVRVRVRDRRTACIPPQGSAAILVMCTQCSGVTCPATKPSRQHTPQRAGRHPRDALPPTRRPLAVVRCDQRGALPRWDCATARDGVHDTRFSVVRWDDERVGRDCARYARVRQCRLRYQW